MAWKSSAVWIAFALASWPAGALAQDHLSNWDSPPSIDSSKEQPETTAGRHPCFAKEGVVTSKELENKALSKLPALMRAWLTEDVRDIIEPGEACAFLHLKQPEDRDLFIERFWLRRSPDPDLPDNRFKQEHYRRIVFANQKFGTGKPGFQADRGRVHVLFGPPDTIDLHPRGGCDQKEAQASGGCTHSFPWERWNYRYIEGFGENVQLDFVDPSGSGDYRLALGDDEKAYVFAGVRPTWRDWSDIHAPALVLNTPDGQEIRLWVGPMSEPRIRFRDLEQMVVHKLIRDQIYLDTNISYQRATHATTVAQIAIDIPTDQRGLSRAQGAPRFEIFARITRSDGWVVDTLEADWSPEENKENGEPPLGPTFSSPLWPGAYDLAIVVKEVVSGQVGVLYTVLTVPTFDSSQ